MGKLRMASGRAHLIGIAMDVTEQHRLAQRYQEADQRLAVAIECTSETFALWDKDDRLVMCNAHYQQAYGLPDEALVPGTERSVVHAAAARPVIARRVADVGGSNSAQIDRSSAPKSAAFSPRLTRKRARMSLSARTI